MDLGCPLLRGSSVRRLRRRAATILLLLKRTFPGSISSSAFGAAAVRKVLTAKNIFSLVQHRSRTCCHLSSYETSPSCQRCSRSLGASISVTVLKAPVTAGCNCCHCHPLYGLPPPLLPGCWMDGRQVQIVQARWNDWELPSKSVWHCWLVGVVIDG